MTKQTGTLVRIDPHGVGYIQSGGEERGFTFDKIEGYRGESVKEMGLKAGQPIGVTIAPDGMIATVNIRACCACKARGVNLCTAYTPETCPLNRPAVLVESSQPDAG